MSAPEYPVGTIFEMAKIPADRFEHFLVELPEIVAMIRGQGELSAILSEATGGDAKLEFVSPIWVDDGARNRTVRLMTRDAEGTPIEICSAHVKGDA